MDDTLLNLVEENELPEPYDHIAKVIGLEATKKLAKEFGGENIYLPKVDTMLQAVRDKMIREEFNGYNYTYLAKKYGLTSRWIKEIVSPIQEAVRKRPLDGQLSLLESG